MSFIVLVILFGKLITTSLSLSRVSKIPMPFLIGMTEIINNYDVFIIDQWGVLHNGKSPYKLVNACLLEMKAKGKQLILLSNSSKRRLSSFEGLKRVGIPPSLFNDIVTSGELSWNMIKNRQGNLLETQSLESESEFKMVKVFVIGNGDDDEEYLSSCNCIMSKPSDAEFILVRGTFCIWQDQDLKVSYPTAEKMMENVQEILEVCASYRLAMLVTNPDYHRPGSNSPMPGLVAAKYLEVFNEAKISYIGKPHQNVYDECLESVANDLDIAKEDIDLSRICCIGDSMEHDIVGAMQAGMDSVWIANGVHCMELGTEEGWPELPSESRLSAFLTKHSSIRPTYIVPAFQL